MESANGLPFDDRVLSYLIITRPETALLHLGTEDSQAMRHSTRRLARVHHDAWPSHQLSIQAKVCRDSAEPVSEEQQLALSRSESA
jgi:hypothetical protein